MLLKELLQNLQIEYSHGSLDIEISDIAYDSRKVKSGSLFICIEGYKVDGHKFIDAAISAGAVAILSQKDIEVESCAAVIKVADTRKALAHISSAFFGNPSNSFDLIGITGTKGKTTISFMIKSILESKNKKVGLIGTIANYIGEKSVTSERTTPESYDLQKLFTEMKSQNVNCTVMEVSSHALELSRVAASCFDVGIFTNLSQDHLDFHGNFDNYLEAKLKLFTMCKTGLVNIDSEYKEQVIKASPCKMFTFGLSERADIRAVNISSTSNSVSFSVITPWEDKNGEITVNIPGRFSVYNALAAIGAACLTGIPFKNIKEGLSLVKVPGRAEIVYSSEKFTVMLDYAHSPDSLENILTAVREYAPARVVCMFGCGGDRDKTKRPIMGEIAGMLSDFTIITSDNPRSEEPEEIVREIEQGIRETGSKYITIVNRYQAIEYALLHAEPKDIIVLAGKGHETYQIFKDKTIHFDEKEIVKEILDL